MITLFLSAACLPIPSTGAGEVPRILRRKKLLLAPTTFTEDPPGVTSGRRTLLMSPPAPRTREGICLIHTSNKSGTQDLRKAIRYPFPLVNTPLSSVFSRSFLSLLRDGGFSATCCSELQKGGVPAAPSGTATLLRLSPSHRYYPSTPLAVTSFRYPRLPWLDGRCVQGPGTYSPRHG